MPTVLDMYLAQRAQGRAQDDQALIQALQNQGALQQVQMQGQVAQQLAKVQAQLATAQGQERFALQKQWRELLRQDAREKSSSMIWTMGAMQMMARGNEALERTLNRHERQLQRQYSDEAKLYDRTLSQVQRDIANPDRMKKLVSELASETWWNFKLRQSEDTGKEWGIDFLAENTRQILGEKVKDLLPVMAKRALEDPQKATPLQVYTAAHALEELQARLDQESLRYGGNFYRQAWEGVSRGLSAALGQDPDTVARRARITVDDWFRSRIEQLRADPKYTQWEGKRLLDDLLEYRQQVTAEYGEDADPIMMAIQEAAVNGDTEAIPRLMGKLTKLRRRYTSEANAYSPKLRSGADLIQEPETEAQPTGTLPEAAAEPAAPPMTRTEMYEPSETNRGGYARLRRTGEAEATEFSPRDIQDAMTHTRQRFRAGAGVWDARNRRDIARGQLVPRQVSSGDEGRMVTEWGEPAPPEPEPIDPAIQQEAYLAALESVPDESLRFFPPTRPRPRRTTLDVGVQ